MIDRRYRFLRPWRQYKRGDLVPESFDAGMIGTMAQVGIIGCPARVQETPKTENKGSVKTRRKAGLTVGE
jgi:hypothetical protein